MWPVASYQELWCMCTLGHRVYIYIIQKPELYLLILWYAYTNISKIFVWWHTLLHHPTTVCSCLFTEFAACRSICSSQCIYTVLVTVPGVLCGSWGLSGLNLHKFERSPDQGLASVYVQAGVVCQISEHTKHVDNGQKRSMGLYIPHYFSNRGIIIYIRASRTHFMPVYPEVIILLCRRHFIPYSNRLPFEHYSGTPLIWTPNGIEQAVYYIMHWCPIKCRQELLLG